MTFRTLTTVTLLTCWLLASGCAASKATSNHEKVAVDARRDTEQARRLSAEGLELIDQGKYNEAEKVLKRAVEADTMFGPAHNNLGLAYYNQQRYYDAAWEFEYAGKLLPDRPEPRNNLGLVFETVNDLDKAVSWYDQAFKIAPDSAEIVGNLARAKLRRGDVNDGLHELLLKLSLKDSRPDWRAWAERQDALLGDHASPQTMPSTDP